jgi:ankyrin repeat protein
LSPISIPVIEPYSTQKRPIIDACLLQRGAHVNGANGDGYTALHFAAMMGHSSVCRLLIAAGADIAVSDIYGDQPIDRAEAEGHPVVEWKLVCVCG